MGWYEVLKPLAGELDHLHDKIKGTFKGIPKALVGGRYIVQIVPSKRTVYDLPDEAEEAIRAIKKEHGTVVPVEKLVIQAVEAPKS